jgi:hypothetical protein
MDPMSAAMNGDEVDMEETDRMEISHVRSEDGSFEIRRRRVMERLESMRSAPPVHVTYAPSRSPSDAMRVRQRLAAQERDGFDPDAGCDFCVVTDRAAKHVPENVDRLYECIADSLATLPLSVATSIIARKYNEEIVAADEAESDPKKKMHLMRVTQSEVERHILDETLCLPGNEVQLLTELIKTSYASLDDIAATQLYVERYENGEPTGVIEANWKGHNVHAKELAKLLRLILERTKIMEAREKRRAMDASKKSAGDARQTFETYYLATQY